MREDFVTEEFGDCRQELVFIGVDINEAGICQALDDCLLSDKEMDHYRQQLKLSSSSSSGEGSTAGLISSSKEKGRLQRPSLASSLFLDDDERRRKSTAAAAAVDESDTDRLEKTSKCSVCA